ncbi:exopolyphosphatase [Vibrio sp. 10N.261.55.A7]|uniref:exopolyphosphatase n=1 Tax=Vibrio sp. 10N.261.55.A7 TaxID=1880851 RepID=UPI000C81B83A|nr:exopolyphosphatase [Vibrio sp. 10N.261.55.A7]PMJ90167.1 exopolyphosphatase [Vibrio sp. 10N.261.55.A7]
MTDSKETRNIAAIDLGSNSFHMVVAKVVDQDLQLVSRHKQRVRLAAGLDKDKKLDEASILRGLECLEMFAERLQGFELANVRIAATHTLRQAANAHEFLFRAQSAIPFPIEIIPGTEEARLIYAGVSHTQPESNSKLVIDIGGGSTEMIIGHGFEPSLVTSKQLGCVSYTQRYFPKGHLSSINFIKASIATGQHLQGIRSKYKNKGWDIAIGSSGTIKAIREVLIGLGHDDGIITSRRIEQLIETLCQWTTIEDIQLKGLAPERQPVFVGGVVVLHGIINALDIDELHYSEGALREGLLYEMEDQFKRLDIRMRTTENLAKKHLVDLVHANNVKQQANAFFLQVRRELGIKKSSPLFSLLEWSALLHEVGLSISLQAFHRHSAYILKHTNMPGFNQEQQQVLATLARFQRKGLKLNEMDDLTLYKRKHILSLIKILRLAILVNGQRNDTHNASLKLSVSGEVWTVGSSNEQWLKENKLLSADLETEQELWNNADWTLQF